MADNVASTNDSALDPVGDYEFLLYERRGRVVWITLNRPEVLNAMHPPLSAEIDDAWDRFRDDSQAWVAIITGAGERAFSAGADLKWRASEGDALRGNRASVRAARRGLECWKPVIAAVNGYAVGGGLELAMSCDIIIAAEHARFGLPEPRRGLVADAGGIHRLVRRIPFGLAMGLILTGNFIEAHEAREVGLVNEVVHAGELRDAAQRWADEISQCSPLAVQACKEMAVRGLQVSFGEAVDMDYSSFRRLEESEDFIEGSRAFTEKRRPSWKGR
jgi:enoyl-CoA hydratase/carnithine racemase